MMSNALSSTLPGLWSRLRLPGVLAAAEPQTAPAEAEGLHPALAALVAVGVCVLVVWIVRRIADPSKISLRRAPGRPNTVHPVHLVGILLAMWLSAAVAQGLLRGLVVPSAAEGAARKAAEARLAIASGLVGSCVWLLAGLVVARVSFRHGLARGLGLSCRRWLYDSARALLGYLAVLPICVGLLLLLLHVFLIFGAEPHPHPVLEGWAAFPPAWRVLSTVSAVVLAPLTEEVFFRGLLQSMIRRWSPSPWVAIVAASVLFTAFHVNQPQALPSLFALSVALGYNYERTGRLYAPILIHAVFNAVNLWVWTSS